jgi:3-isopropylmalate dehydrogenase
MKDGKMAGWSPVIGNRIKLNLYANVRPIKLLPGVRHGLSGRFLQAWEPGQVDMIFVRENTEGLYSGIGGRAGDAAIDTRVITRAASRRVIKKAFELSRARGTGAPLDGKKRVTCVVKHNVLHGCKLFLDVYREVAAEFPDVAQDVAIVDSFAMFMLLRPESYDVVVSTNMFGDILTDLGSVLQGGMGMAVGCNVGDDHAMFEPIHGSAPPMAGKDVANPLAMLGATAEALRWLGRRHGDERLVRGARAIDEAIAAIVALAARAAPPAAAAARRWPAERARPRDELATIATDQARIAALEADLARPRPDAACRGLIGWCPGGGGGARDASPSWHRGGCAPALEAFAHAIAAADRRIRAVTGEPGHSELLPRPAVHHQRRGAPF